MGTYWRTYEQKGVTSGRFYGFEGARRFDTGLHTAANALAFAI